MHERAAASDSDDAATQFCASPREKRTQTVIYVSHETKVAACVSIDELERVTFKTWQDKLTNAMIDRLEKEVDMLERHLQVLKMVIESEPIGIVKMSNETGYPHHKVRYSLRVLEEENLIEPSSQGAITTERTAEFVDELDEKLDEIVDKLDSMKIEEAAEIEG
ncbi:Predicted transcriptional regulator [Halopelagius inordinatus]|uniref:Predicted transcriptional regulator n=3 Tax=Halopelagius TaxID=1008195 RepID=A0A1I2NS59_9EURY|nr:Predicted transcriptional regulator [Halopelagius inordinatus]